MLGRKLHSGTFKTKERRSALVQVPLFWKCQCVTCVPAWLIPYYVIGSCKGPIYPRLTAITLAASHSLVKNGPAVFTIACHWRVWQRTKVCVKTFTSSLAKLYIDWQTVSIIITRWFSQRAGTSLDDDARRTNTQIWANWNRIRATPRALQSSSDVPVLLLN